MPDNPEYWVSTVNSISALNLPCKDLLSKVVSDRISLLYDTIIEVNRHLHARTTLARNIQSHIDESICSTVNLQYELNSDPNSKTSLENQINELHKEKRQQQLSHWKDTVELKREMRNAKKEMRNAMLDLWMITYLN